MFIYIVIFVSIISAWIQVIGMELDLSRPRPNWRRVMSPLLSLRVPRFAWKVSGYAINCMQIASTQTLCWPFDKATKNMQMNRTKFQWPNQKQNVSKWSNSQVSFFSRLLSSCKQQCCLVICCNLIWKIHSSWPSSYVIMQRIWALRFVRLFYSEKATGAG